MIATCITAGVAVLAYWQSRKLFNRDNPHVEIVHGQSIKRTVEYPMQVYFRVPEKFADAWAVEAVRVSYPMLARLISRPEISVQDNMGNEIAYKTSKWRNKIKIDYTRSGLLILSRSAPSEVSLRFTLSLKSDPSTKSRCSVRIKIIDVKAKNIDDKVRQN